MKLRPEDTSSEEEEEEEEDDVQVRRSGGFRLVTSSIQNAEASESSQQEEAPPLTPKSPKTPTKPSAPAAEAQAGQQAAEELQKQAEERQKQLQAQQEAARARQQEAIEKAREEALRLQAEARARAEAARQQQQQQQGQTVQVSSQQSQQKQPQQQGGAVDQQQKQAEQLKAQQEAAKKQAELRAQQLKAQQEAAKKQVEERAKTAAQQTQPQPPQKGDIQPQQQQPQQQVRQQPQVPAQQQQQKQQQGGTNNLGPAKPILSHHSFQPRMGAQGDQPAEPQQVPRHQALEDSSWQVQRRVPQEDIQQVQPGRITVPEFQELGNVKPTVIVPQSTQYSKIKWNEFPEEEEKQRESVPKVKAQDWVPENEQEHVILKTNYQPGKIARAWPPPGYGEEEEVQLGRAAATKAVSDDGWIQANESQEANGEQEAVGNAPWRRQVGGSGIKSRVWPPPDTWQESEGFGAGPKLSVQWPPPDQEEKEQQEVQVIQTHLPVKPHQRQWPPPEPETAIPAQ